MFIRVARYTRVDKAASDLSRVQPVCPYYTTLPKEILLFLTKYINYHTHCEHVMHWWNISSLLSLCGQSSSEPLLPVLTWNRGYGPHNLDPSVAPTFVTSTTFVTVHQFCQFISTAFVNLTTFYNFCQLRANQFCQQHQPLMSLQTRSLLLSTRLDHFKFVNRNFIILLTYVWYAQSHF